MTPVRVVAKSIVKAYSDDASAGVCPYVRAFSSSVSSEPGRAVIVATLCDQMRRYSELMESEQDKPVFLLNVPRTWETPAANRMYVDELKRLGRFLVEIGGASPSETCLAETILQWDEHRQELLGCRSSQSPREFTTAIMRFGRTGKVSATDLRESNPAEGVPLALVGGPMLEEHLSFFDIIEQSGGYVALDATSTGERSLPGNIDRRLVRENPLQTLSDAYFGTITDAGRRPNSTLYQWLRRRLSEEGIRGMIFLRYTWCDTWHAEAQRMKDWLGLPFFDLDIGDSDSDTGRRLTRFEAFMEMLR